MKIVILGFIFTRLFFAKLSLIPKRFFIAIMGIRILKFQDSTLLLSTFCLIPLRFVK